MTTSQWLTLSDLGHRFGLSARHCGRVLDHEGWRDRSGHPTQAAIAAGAAQQHNSRYHIPSNRWNAEICATVLSSHGQRPLKRSERVSQWVTLLGHGRRIGVDLHEHRSNGRRPSHRSH